MSTIDKGNGNDKDNGKDKATLDEVRAALKKCGYEDAGHLAHRYAIVRGQWWKLPNGRLYLLSDFFVNHNAVHELIDAAKTRLNVRFDFNNDETDHGGLQWSVVPMRVVSEGIVQYFDKESELVVVYADDFCTAVVRAINQIPEVM